MKSLVLLLATSLCFVVLAGGTGWQSHRQLRSSRQCRIERLRASRPNQRLQSEGGTTELWDQTEDQFQCVGVAAMRNIIRPNSLSLPNFSPSPRIVYVQQGKGLLGISYPGCPNTFQSGGRETYQGRRGEQEERYQEERGRRRGEQEEREMSPRRERGQQQTRERGQRGEQEGESIQDHHQKVHRIREGDVVALPAGAVHWCFNDGNEELIALSVTDFSSQTNQLNQEALSFYLAGGQPKGQQRGQRQQRSQEQEKGRGSRETRGSESEEEEESHGSEEEGAWYNAVNILRDLDANLISEALGVSREVVQKMQKDEGQGFIVKVKGEGLRSLGPEEEEQEEGYEQQRGRRESDDENGVDETWCSLKINQRLDNPREADVYSRQAGRMNAVNVHKLPILKYLEMSAEKGTLYSNAMCAPAWSMNAHTVYYITQGSGRVQVVGHKGKKVLDQRVKEGELFVVPQYYLIVKKADEGGLEWVSFKTSSLPMRSTIAGATSALKGMPAQVLSSAFGIGLRQAHDIKHKRGHEMQVLSPTTRSSS